MIIHSVADIDKHSGGPSYTVTSLCRELLAMGEQVSIATLNTHHEKVETDVPVDQFEVKWNKRLGFSPELKRYLLERLDANDVLHGHGLWMMPNLYVGTIKKQTGCKLVISTRGMLSQWALAQSSIKKKLVLKLGQRQALEQADCLHATAESEYEDIRRFGLKNPVAIIPNGIDVPEDGHCGNKRSKTSDQRSVLFLSRIHPKKGLENLFEAWRQLAPEFQNWHLNVCGPGDEDYLRQIRAKIDALGESIRYVQPVYGEAKSKLYFESDVFVLPTKSENFGMVVAEALAHKVPCVVTEGAPWQGLSTHHCGWWVGLETDAIRSGLRSAMACNDETRSAMGENGYAWMKSSYSWESIGTEMQSVYAWLGGAEKPSCVRID